MRGLILIVLILGGTPLQAQTCELSQRIIDCWNLFLPAPEPVEEAKESASAETGNQVAMANTGITNLLSPSDSALKDFLTLLSMSLESATFAEDANSQAFTFDWNPQLAFLGTPTAFKFQAVFNNAQLSSDLTTALESNAAAITTLDQSLDLESDVALSGTVNPMSARFGRSIEPHRTYFQTVLLEVLPDQTKEFDELIQALSSANLQPRNRFDQAPADQQQSLLRRVQDTARAAQAKRNKTKTFTDAFATLLSNQSQFYASAIYSARRNIVGPNQFSGKITYEHGPRNLSSFQRNNADCDSSKVSSANAVACADKMVAYARDAATDRIAFSLQYDRTNRRWIDLPDLAVAYGIPRSTRLVYSLTYGRPLTAPMGERSARVDLSIDYEDVQNSVEKVNRLVGSATYTYKVNDSFSLPISLVYASHEADLPTTDEKLNAHFGLIYKMPDLPNLFGKK